MEASRAHVVAVGGGKGGVGKSVVAANLAIAFARMGLRVVIVDADLGAANQHTLLNITRPAHTLQEFLDRRVASLEEVRLKTAVFGMSLVAGCGAVPGAANIPHAQKLRLIRHIRALQADVVVIDCGSGVSYNVIDLFRIADSKITVATPQLTSLHNAYAFLKAVVHRSMGDKAENAEERDILKRSIGQGEVDPLPEAVTRVRAEDDELADELTDSLRARGFYIVGNQLESDSQIPVFRSFVKMVGRYLGIRAEVLCTMPVNRWIHESVTRRRPWILSDVCVVEARVLLQSAAKLLEAQPPPSRPSLVDAKPANGRRDTVEFHLGPPYDVARNG